MRERANMQGKPKPVRAHEREVGKGEKMKSIMISIQPKWCAKIESGAKTIEVRKTRPKIETPFKCYIYCTFPQKPVYDIWINRGTENRFLGNGKVIGEFVCNNIEKFVVGSLACDDVEKQVCLSYKEICDYFYGENYDNTVRIGYGWHISELKIYDKPKELGEFYRRLSEKVLEEGDYDCRKDENVICLDYWDGGGDNCQDCPFGGKVYLTRPPQSWCYVEELED